MPTTNTVSSVSVIIPASRAVWTDSGMVLGPTDSLRVLAEGQVFFGPNPTDGAWPEGSYLDRDPNHLYDPGSVNHYDGITDLQFIAFGTATEPASLVVCFRDEGVTPPATANSVTDATTTTRDITFNLPTSGGTKRVWLLFNDLVGNYGNNSGQFVVTLERLNDDDPPPNVEYGPPHGGRTVPTRLMQMYQEQAQTVCLMWAVQPVNGAWEAYTSLDKSLSAPRYVSVNGLNPIPAMTYLSRKGVSASGIPCRLKLEASGVDVTVLNFDRDGLKAGYYDSAEIEVFEVNWRGNLNDRVVLFSGQLGTAEVHDLDAMIQLVGWDSLANSPIGDTVRATCPYEFCGAGCRVDSIDSGPVASDWTRSGTVVSVTTDMKLIVNVTGSTGGSTYLSHLDEGRLSFTDGPNNGISRDVKTGTVIPATSTHVELTLHQATPFLPVAGDGITLRSGCHKDFAGDCADYGNKINFGGFPFIPLREGVMRRG